MIKLFSLPKRKPARRRVSTKLSAEYQSRRTRELRDARLRFLAAK